MVEARDMVCVSVPFAAGVAAGLFLCLFLPPSFRSAAAGLLAASSGMFLICLRRVRTLSPHLVFAGIFLLTGCFCAFNASMLGDAARWEGGGPTRAVESLRGIIDRIPYPSPTTAPLVKALLTGDRSGLDPGTLEAFRRSGASHLLALSGLHLGVIYGMLLQLTRPLGNSLRARAGKAALAVGASGFYAVMTGASPSIVRAFLFIALNETAKLLGREREPVRILLAALTLQLALKPAVISSAGFQLSYLAMAGIFILYPSLERWYPGSGSRSRDRLDPVRRIWQAAALSISCQAFTAPVAWWHFHTFPRYFLLTNLIAMPLTSAIMILSVLTIALSALGVCPLWLAGLDDRAVGALVRSLGIISGM